VELLVTGRIASLDGPSGMGWVEALAVSGGRVIAAGSEAEVEGLASGATRRLDLGPDHVALPGLTDAHLHLADAAQAATQLRLGPETSLEDALLQIADLDRARRESGDVDGWLLGRGWSFDGFGGWPVQADLEQLAPGRPIALWAHDHHARWFSPAAMRLAGIGPQTPDPAGGALLRGSDGRPNGVALEHAAGLIEPLIPAPDPERLGEAIGRFASELLRWGIVAVHDPGEVAPEPALARGPILYGHLASAGRLPLRVHASVRAEQLDRAAELGLQSGQSAPAVDAADPEAIRSAARARIGWLKVFADGSLGSRTAWLLDPYQDVGGLGGALIERGELEELVRRGADLGIATQVHAIGDRAARVTLDALAAVPAARGLRLAARIEHAQLVEVNDVRRFGRLGVGASVQPSHLAGDGPAAGLAWPDRLIDAYRWRSFLKVGAALAFGSDAPVESPDPWPGIALAVTRRPTPTAARFPGEETLTIAQALRAAILGPAIMSGEEGIRGRLSAGHLADLIVLPTDVIDEPVHPAGRLATARSLLTLVDGREAWRDPAFDRGG
jgi:predicted amidohydrolase YtcJ